MAVFSNLILASFLFWGLGESWTMAQPVLDGIAAIVNSEVITHSELHQELKDETVRLKAKFQGKTLRQKLLQKEYTVLNRLIERKLQIQEAKAKGLTITEGELQRAMDQIRSGGTSTTLKDVSEKMIREELLIRKLIDFEVRRNLMVSPAELLDHFENSKHQFMEPAVYRLRQILLLPKPGDTDRTLEQKAEQILTKLRAGQSFDEVAQFHSEGPESARGGDLGYVRKDELLTTLGSMLDQLKPGEVSPPIRSSIGMHILMVEDIKLGEVREFEEVKDMIRARLIQKKTQEAQQQWLSSLKDKAYIEIKL